MAGSAHVPSIEGIDGLELVGQGGFAAVYRGHQAAFRRDVAVKVLQRSGLDEDDRRRFDRECQAMGALSNHPGIVTLYDAGFTADERPYLVMAYVAQGTLHDSVASSGPMSWQEVTALGVRLCGALETAHRAGVLHRDIKPANVLRSEYGEQLSDFGIARIQGGHETRSGVITASVAHAAPEILDGHSPTAQADVYALASTLYEALTGRAAFVRDTDEGLLPLIRRVVSEPPPDLRGRGVPDPVASVVERAMSKEPNDRYATAEEFGLALREAQAVTGVRVTDMAIVGGAGTVADAAVPPSTAVAASEPQPAPGGPPPPGLPPGDATPQAGELPIEPGDDRSGRWKTVLIAGVFAALVALVIGLVVIAGGDEQPASIGTTPTVVDPADTTVGTAATETLAPPTDPPTETTVPSETTTPPVDGGPPLQVGVVASLIDESHPFLAGLDQAANGLGVEITRSSPTVDPGVGMSDLISSGQNPIIALASEPARDGVVAAVESNAAAHPEVTFIVIDAEIEAPNVSSMVFAEDEGSFLVGAIAALTTTTDRVGFLGGADTEEIEPYEAGFVAGVRHVEPTVQVDVQHLPGDGESYFDEDMAFERANAMYEAGADVIYHAGTSGVGLFDAASDAAGRWAIGVDTDQALTADPGVREAILTSMVKRYAEVTNLALSAAVEGTLAPGLRLFGVAEGAVRWSTTDGRVEQFAPEVVGVRDGIANGEIEAPGIVDQRALAPQLATCPTDGCQIRILDGEFTETELELTLEANWFLDVGGMHAHYYWSPQYTSEQVGGDSAARFGVEVGAWDLDDSYPTYITEGDASLAARGDSVEICVTAADVGHNVLNPDLFDCYSFADAPVDE